MSEKKTDQYVLGDEPPKERKPEEAATESKSQLPEVFGLVATIPDTKTGAIAAALVKLGVSDASLLALRSEVDEELKGYDGSKAAYERLGKFRNKIVRTNRTPLKEELAAARAEAISFQKLCVSAENLVVEFYQSQEGRLKTQEGLYEAEQARQADEKAKVERERVAALFKQLQAVDWPGNGLMVSQMTPEEFTAALAKATENFELVLVARKAEADKKKREEEEAEERQKKLDAEAAKLEEDRKKFEAEKAALESEKQKIKDQEDQREKDRLKKEADDLKAKNEAAEKENQRLRDLQAQKDKEEADRLAAQQAEENKKAEEKRLAELAPDKEKIGVWCAHVLGHALPAPTIKDEVLSERLTESVAAIKAVLQSLAAEVS